MGAVRHVARGELGDPARRRPGRALAWSGPRGLPSLRGTGRAHVPARHPGDRVHRSLEPALRVLRRLAHRRGRAGAVPGGLQVLVRPGLRDDRDDRGHQRARGPRTTTPTAPAGTCCVRPAGPTGASRSASWTPTPTTTWPRARWARSGPGRPTTWSGYWGRPDDDRRRRAGRRLVAHRRRRLPRRARAISSCTTGSRT